MQQHIIAYIYEYTQVFLQLYNITAFYFSIDLWLQFVENGAKYCVYYAVYIYYIIKLIHTHVDIYLSFDESFKYNCHFLLQPNN